ncbi:hypothetical protein ANN_00751 [Periplaneta americana]|uniref:Uncharacterized protein n=1 Tax=Periplaneta americana TaxID=6978 RepID=A0ABQ8TRM9_PERAM|nr:hypothetical protein ANN_00751 [Periplaneta americana]
MEVVYVWNKDGNSRRVDIIAIDRGNGRAIIIDPTVRFETAVEQPVAVHEEKKTIYDPTIQYFSDYYHIQGQIEVFGLLNGGKNSSYFLIAREVAKRPIPSHLGGGKRVSNPHPTRNSCFCVRYMDDESFETFSTLSVKALSKTHWGLFSLCGPGAFPSLPPPSVSTSLRPRYGVIDWPTPLSVLGSKLGLTALTCVVAVFMAGGHV